MTRITEPVSDVLNLTRFICSQGVLIGHLVVFFGMENQYLISMTSYCVLMFFVLSGFLISYSLQQKIISDPSYSFRQFFRDRFFRIFPPYIGALLLVVLVDFIGFQFTGQYFSWPIYGTNFIINSLQLQEFPVATFIQEKYQIEFFRFHYLGTNLPLWTISIEWWLYMFYGFVFFFFIQAKKIKPLNFLILALLLISPAYYMFVSARMEKGLTLYWFMGILLTATSPLLNNIGRWSFYVAVIVLIGGIFGFNVFGPSASILIFLFGIFLLLQTGVASKLQWHHLLKTISEKAAGYSYSLYLIHYSLIFFITTVFTFEKDVSHFICVFLIVNIIAFIFAEFFEKNSKKLKLIYENYRSGTN